MQTQRKSGLGDSSGKWIKHFKIVAKGKSNETDSELFITYFAKAIFPRNRF